MTPQQYKAYLRKVQREVDNYNRKVKSANKKAVDDYNREVKRVNDHNRKVYSQRKKAVQDYNREVDKFNSSQRQRKRNYEAQLRRLNSTSTTTHILNSTTNISRSSKNLSSSYSNLISDPLINSNTSELINNWPERETSNSLDLTNALNGHYVENISLDFLQNSEVESSLTILSSDLGNRWRGALFSLNHHNPDASRHFCSSAREILTKVINIKAPDNRVILKYPDCEMHGKSPNRRSKLRFILNNSSIIIKSVLDFVDNDIDDVLNLFGELNKGTHGESGKFNAQQLIRLKKRVEDSIAYIMKF